MQLDHLVLATPEPEATLAELAAATGVIAAEGGPHAGLGTRNWLAALATGDPADRTYLEIIGLDPDQPEPEAPRPFGIDELQGPSFVWWCARTDRIDELAGAAAGDIEFSAPMEMRRLAPEGELVWKLSFPSELGGAIPFVIDWLDSPHPSASSPSGLRLERMVITDPSADRLASRLGALGEFPLEIRHEPVAALRAVLAGPAGSYELRSANR